MNGLLRVTLRLDTPLLQGGPSARSCDPALRLRGPAVRGLLHCFARALVGPLVGGHAGKAQAAEKALLGSAGDDADLGGSPTFRVCDVSEVALGVPARDPYWNCPHDKMKGERDGHAPADGPDPSAKPRTGMFGPVYDEVDLSRHRELEFRLRPHVEALRGREFAAAFWAVVWTAFTLGSIGQRSRRGYGSLTIRDVSDAPRIEGQELPVFPQPPQRDNLFAALETGIPLARHAIQAWLNTITVRPGAADTSYFQVEQVWVGQERTEVPRAWGQDTMRRLMQWCHENRGDPSYALGFGSADPRRGSPCWVRLYRTKGGFVPVLTYSHSAAGIPGLPENRLFDSLCRAFHATRCY